jgi:tetratricopeptide (TPR) repeat protein
MAEEKRITVLKRANRLFQQGRTDIAVNEYKKILELKPDDLQVRRIVGDIELKRNNMKEAVEQYEWIADQYLKEGLYVKAIAAYKRITRVSPDYEAVRLKLARLYIQHDLTMEAKQIYLDFAEKYRHQGLRQKTMEMYQNILEFDPDNIRIRLLLADNYLEEKQAEEAVEGYIAAVDIILAGKDYQRAEELLLNILIKIPGTKVLEKLIQLYTIIEKDDKIINLINAHGLDLFEDVKALKMAAELCWQKNRLGEAEKIVAKIIELAPGEPEIMMRLASVYLEREEYDRAYNLFLPLIDKYFQAKKFEEAANLLRFLIAANNSYLPALIKLSEVFKLSGKINSLIALYESLLPIYEERGMKGELKNILEELCQLSDTPADYEVQLAKHTGVATVSTSEAEEPGAKSDPEIEIPESNPGLELEHPGEKGFDEMFETNFLGSAKGSGNLEPEDSDLVMEYQEEKTGGSLEIPSGEIGNAVMNFDSDEDLLKGESFFLDDGVYFEIEKNVAEELRSLRLLTQPRHGFPVPLRQEGENKNQVICTVFTSPTATKGSEILIQVFAYLFEKFKEAQLMANELAEAPEQSEAEALPAGPPNGTELVLELRMKDVHITHPIRVITWKGFAESVSYAVKIPKAVTQSSLIGKVIISLNRVPIGTIPFRVKIQKNPDSMPAAKRPLPLGDATVYRYAFIAYAAEDKEEVIRRVQRLSSMETGYFQEILIRESGDKGEEKSVQKMAKADVFFLFWSQAALQSEWVRKDISYALQRQQGDEGNSPDIIPVIIEGPPFPEPPPELKHVHFDDKILYFAVNK